MTSRPGQARLGLAEPAASAWAHSRLTAASLHSPAALLQLPPLPPHCAHRATGGGAGAFLGGGDSFLGGGDSFLGGGDSFLGGGEGGR